MNTVLFDVHPKESFLDKQLKIRASGLQPYEKYTLTAFCQLEDCHPGYFSYAQYVANNVGVIDVSTMTSYGGSYVGVAPMGLIWSLKSLHREGKQSLLLRDPKEPFEILYSLYSNHFSPQFDVGQNHDVDQSQSLLIAQCVTRRLNVAPQVKRISIREGRIRGTLFVPQGNGPFRGVIDIDGIGPKGVVFERTASLLASRGYLSLALAYQGYDDLPDMHHIELEYFIEALEWFNSHPLVSKIGLTVSGQCFGGIIALYLSLNCNTVNAVITRNTFSYVVVGTIYFKGQQLPKYIHLSSYIGDRLRQGKEVIGRVAWPPVVDWTLPIEKASHDVRYLFITGEDDYVAHPGHTGLLIDRLKKAGKNNFKVISYPLTGHIITLSYCHYEFFNSGSASLTRLLGGEMYSHVSAEESAWEEMLRFIEGEISLAKL